MAYLYYFFKFLIIFNALCVVLARNPVHSVLFLVLVFLNSAMLIFFLGAEFLSMILIVVYVGAVAVLFLFVCMMLNIKIELNNNIFQNVISTVLFGGLLVLLVGMLLFDIFSNLAILNYIDNLVWVDLFMKQPNGLVIGALIYTFYMHWFLLAGFILLVAMIGAISLTLAHKEGLKRQNLYIQLIRRDK